MTSFAFPGFDRLAGVMDAIAAGLELAWATDSTMASSTGSDTEGCSAFVLRLVVRGVSDLVLDRVVRFVVGLVLFGGITVNSSMTNADRDSTS